MMSTEKQAPAAGEKKTKRGSASNKVFLYLKNAITDGKWKPGEKIYSENQLCGLLGVSRITVRSAIHRLTSLGILESRQGNGTFVCNDISLGNLNSLMPMMLFDQPDRISMFEFRKIIEVATSGLAAQRATTQMVEEMRGFTTKMSEATDVDVIAHNDMEFHYHLAKSTGNSAIIKVFEILRDTYLNMLEENVLKMGAYGARYHHMILSAIEIRNTELAEKYMLEHLNDTIQKTVEFQNEYENMGQKV